ncbi:MAG: energy transducer TonB [Ignavibacteria bacterium]|nr:energy transducer TonB [Ignavibacteria bacterium]
MELKIFLFTLIFLVSAKGFCQDEIEYKLESGKDCNTCISPKALNLIEIKKEILYPDSAKKNKIEGEVKVRLAIDKYGAVQKIIEMNGLHIFYEEVKKACYKLKFSPLYQDNRPIDCYVNVPFKFTISEKKDSVNADTSIYRKTPRGMKFSLIDVNSGLISWITLMILLPVITIIILLKLYRKKK